MARRGHDIRRTTRSRLRRLGPRGEGVGGASAASAARCGRARREWARARIAHFKVPRYFRFVDEFPMTVTGKIRKVQMREESAAELGLS
mgnify:CR=1 FL=1